MAEVVLWSEIERLVAMVAPARKVPAAMVSGPVPRALSATTRSVPELMLVPPV